MPFPVFIPRRFISRYSLLEAMATELVEAFESAGCPVNPTRIRAGQPALHLFLNFPHSLEQVTSWHEDYRRSGGGPSGLVHFFVDHPMALHIGMMDRLAELPHYRLVMPCMDDGHLLRLRWPRIKQIPMAHGVPASALCDASMLEASHLGTIGTSAQRTHPNPSLGEGLVRDIDLVASGWIATAEEVDRHIASTPDSLRGTVREMIDVLTRYPAMSFGQAFDIALPRGAFTSDWWSLMQGLWGAVIPAVNRARRTRLVSAMQGVRMVVHGPDAWREFCTGTIEYGGEIAYAELPRAMARAKVALGWSPTQFTLGFSERLLVGMAAGCACVTEDRVVTRRAFEGCAAWFDQASPQSARDAVEQLLADDECRAAMARRGRDRVEAGHLWKHRLDTLAAVGAGALEASAMAA